MTHLYQVTYRRRGSTERVYRLTVIARDADQARAFAALRDEQFHSTIRSPRKGRAVTPATREFVEWRGTSVEVVD